VNARKSVGRRLLLAGAICGATSFGLVAAAGAAPTGPTCAAGAVPVCTARLSPHFVVIYTLRDPVNGVPTADTYGLDEVSGPDGVPDYIDDLDSSLEDSYITASQLGLQLPAQPTVVVVSASPAAASATAGSLYAGPTSASDVLALSNADATRWVGARTSFFDMIADSYLQAGASRAGNLAGDSWWVEACSYWFAMQSNANSPWLPSAHRADYASAIPEYLARTTEDLTTWDGPTATPARPAGELLLPQYLSEHFGSSIVTDIFVRMNGRPVDPDTSDGVAGARVSGDPLTAITASLAARGHDLPTVLQDFAEANWNLGCPTGADQYGYCSPELTRWLAVLQGDTRTAGAHGDAPSPVHQTVAVSDLFAGSSGQATLGAGGSAYILLALPSVDPNCSGFLCYNGGITVTTAGDEAIP